MVTKARANIYHLFSRIYLKEIDDDFLHVLRAINLLSPSILNEPEVTLINELAEEYAALFLVPGGLPPYESVRIKGLLCQEPATEVEDFYKRCGLVIKEGWKNIFPDHLGLELGFMGYLCDKEVEGGKKWAGYQREFWGLHLSRWCFDYLDDLIKCAFHPFYREVGVLTREFLESERPYIERVMEM